MFATALACIATALAPIEGSSTFHRLSLDAESMCAAGVSAQQVATIVTALNTSPAAINEELTDADNVRGLAAKVVQDLKAEIANGGSTPAQILQLENAEDVLEMADATRDGVLDTLFTAGVVSLSPEIQSRLATIRGNRYWRLPVEFLVANRSQSDWVQLRDHLSQERIATKLEEPLDPAVSQALATARSHSSVSAAFARLGSGLTSVQMAWNAALANYGG